MTVSLSVRPGGCGDVPYCEQVEPSGEACREPTLVGRVCYDHAILGPGDSPMCPISGVWASEAEGRQDGCC